MLEDHVESIVVGAGAIGSAVARRLARAGQDVLVLEGEDSGLHHTSARNSQVMHAGMLYPPGSLKAQLCTQGQRQLYDFCRTRHIDHKRYGKIVIASDPSDLAKLEEVLHQGQQNGVEGLRMLTGHEAMQLEPNLRCLGGLLSPSTGVLDAPAYIRAVQGEAQAAGAMFAYCAPLEHLSLSNTGFRLTVGGAQGMTLTCRNLVNAAGLGAWQVARNFRDMPRSLIPHQNLVKACYFTLTVGKSPFDHLIYPTPNSVIPAMHAIRDTAGQLRFGPTTHYLSPPHIDYSPARLPNDFEVTIRRFWPDLPEDALQPDTSGIRSRTTPVGQPVGDFIISGPQTHGITGLVHLFGMESPGLTASLAIARHVEQLLKAT